MDLTTALRCSILVVTISLAPCLAAQDTAGSGPDSQGSIAEAVDDSAATPADAAAPADQAEAADPAAAPTVPPPISTEASLVMIDQSRHDRVLKLLPGGQDLRSSGTIVGIGIDTLANAVVVVTLDSRGTPVKKSVPVENMESILTAGGVKEKVRDPETARKQEKQKGRALFITLTAVKSFDTYPGNLFIALDGVDGQTILGLSLLSYAGALYGSFAATKNAELGYGKVATMNYAATLTIVYPLLLSVFLHNGTSIDDNDHYNFPAVSDYIRAITTMVGFPLGIYGGYRLQLPGIRNDEYGKAETMKYFSTTIGALGWVLPLYADGGSIRDYLTVAPALHMALIPAGYYVGYSIARDREISSGRGILLYIAGLMGTATGAALPTLFEAEERRIYLSTGMAGYGAGSWFALQYKKDEEYTFWQSVFMGASAVAGTLTGVAIPLIFQADAHQAYTLMAIAGGWSGLLFGERLSRDLFERSPQDNPEILEGFRLDVPIAVSWPMLMVDKDKRRLGRDVAVPLVSAHVGF